MGAGNGRQRRRGWSLALPLLISAGLMLAACGSPASPSPGAEAPSLPPAASRDGAPKPVAAAIRVPDLGKLSGLSASELIALIGKPDFRRVEPPAELWQYRSADCVVDIFLYGDGPAYRVVHAESRDRDPSGVSRGHCTDGTHALHGRVQQSRLHGPAEKPLLERHWSRFGGWA